MTPFGFIRKLWTQPLTGLCLSAFTLLLISAGAQAQQDPQDRLNRLENEIQTLSRAVFKGEIPPPEVAGQMIGSGPEAQANIDARLSQMESDLRALTGRLEEQEHAVQSLQSRLDQAMAALAVTPPMQQQQQPVMTYPESSPGGMASSGSDQIAEPFSMGGSPDMPAPADAPTTGQLGAISQSGASLGDPAADSYERAFGLLKDRRNDEAEAAFRDFLQKNPSHALAANAQYWLAETFYVRGDYPQAAREFAASYQKYPQGTKRPDSLLKMALSLAGMGKKPDACAVIVQLKKEYASGAGPVMARADKEAQTLGCP